MTKRDDKDITKCTIGETPVLRSHLEAEAVGKSTLISDTNWVDLVPGNESTGERYTIAVGEGDHPDYREL